MMHPVEDSVLIWSLQHSGQGGEACRKTLLYVAMCQLWHAQLCPEVHEQC